MRGREKRGQRESLLDVSVMGGGIRPDLIDVAKHEIYEIKPDNYAAITLGYTKILAYLTLLNALDKSHWWKPGSSYIPPTLIPLNDEAAALVAPPAAGLITYNVLSFTETIALVTGAMAATLADVELGVGVAVTNAAISRVAL